MRKVAVASLVVALVCLAASVAFAQTPATMITPPPGTTLSGSSVTFSWTTGTGVSEYWLWIGSAPGTFNYYDANEGLNTSQTVNNLPTDGSTVYVRLESWINGAWQWNDYTYTAATISAPAVMLSPVNNSVLPGPSVTFKWSTGVLVSEYWLHIGTTPGGMNLYDANQGLNTSVTVNNLPTDGSTVYVELQSWINGAWQSNSYTYTAVQPAAMTSPAPNSILPGSSTTFNWSAGLGATEYWLWVGSAPGTYNYYDANEGLNTSQTVNNLPMDGSKVYVRLESWIEGAWEYHDYVYTSPAPATMISPAANSVLPGSSTTFTWTTGTGATEYWLHIGTTPGGMNIYDANEGLNTSQIVNNLPTNGAPIYVELQSLINGGWQNQEYVYTAYSQPATMTSPSPGSILTGSSVTFNWTTGVGVNEYWLHIGTAPGALNLYDANEGLNTSQTVDNLPTNGAPIYVQLQSWINGAWQNQNYVYTAYSQPAAMLTPTPGTKLPGTSTTFTWTTGVGVSEYWLHIGTKPGGLDLYDANQGLNTSVTVDNLPNDGSPVYVELQSWIYGAWQNQEYVYKASLPSTPVVTILQTNNPQVAQYHIIVPNDGKVWVNFGVNAYDHDTWQVQGPSGGGVLDILVAGMLPNTQYHLQGQIAYDDGSGWTDIDRTFQSGGLIASYMPGITIQQPNALLTPSPGVELVNGIRPTGSQVQNFAVDMNGNMVWYYAQLPAGGTVNPIKLLPNGHFMMVIGGNTNNTLREIDLAGNTIHDFFLADLQAALNVAGYGYYTVNSMHHDFLRLDNGHTILLVNRNKSINGSNVLGDAIVDLDANNHVVWLWDTFDHLDTNRFPYGYTPRSDWTHCNALYYSPVDHSLLLSCRHQSWVVKIDYNDGTGTGNVLWRLGYQGDFTMASGDTAEWQYGQHNPTVLSQSGSKITLILFDDGNYRITNGVQCDGTTVACQSRNVIYNLDTSTMTANDVWFYAPTGVYSQATGSSQMLDNGDVEASFNFIFGANGTSRIIEVTHSMPARVVWELDLSGETAYRSTRMGSLYPGVQW